MAAVEKTANNGYKLQHGDLGKTFEHNFQESGQLGLEKEHSNPIQSHSSEFFKKKEEGSGISYSCAGSGKAG